MQLFAALVFIVALSRPTLANGRILTDTEPVAIIFLVDISASMSAMEFAPDNRLEKAKQLLQDFVNQRPYTQIGLVAFADQAYVLAPPTSDHTYIQTQINTLDLAINKGLPDGSSLGVGINTAAYLLQQHPATQKSVILLTDGNNEDPQFNPIQAMQVAHTLNINTYIIQLGDSDLAPIPQQGIDGDYIVYWQSTTNQALLEEMTQFENSTLYLANSTANIEAIFQHLEHAIAPNSPPQIIHQNIELFPWLIGLGLLLLFGDTILRQTLIWSVIDG